MKKPVIYTIGHSTHEIDEFIEILKAHGIQQIVDVRSIPRSRHNPQFNKEDLAVSLRRPRVRYTHIEKLGGLRRAKKDSQNLGWRNASFRGYADYMSTPEFERGLEALIQIARVHTTAIMCAEAVPWRCHRSLIGDTLIKKGWLVRNIMSRTSVTKHRLTSFLRMQKGQIIYPLPTS